MKPDTSSLTLTGAALPSSAHSTEVNTGPTLGSGNTTQDQAFPATGTAGSVQLSSGGLSQSHSATSKKANRRTQRQSQPLTLCTAAENTSTPTFKFNVPETFSADSIQFQPAHQVPKPSGLRSSTTQPALVLPPIPTLQPPLVQPALPQFSFSQLAQQGLQLASSLMTPSPSSPTHKKTEFKIVDVVCK